MAVLTVLLAAATIASAQNPPAQAPPAQGPGRVVVTITLEGVRIPAVSVELRNADANIMVGQTTGHSDPCSCPDERFPVK